MHIDLWAWIIFYAPRKKSRWFARSRNSQELISITQQITNLELQNHKWALRHLNQELVGPLPSKRLVMIRILTINKLKEWKLKNKSYLSLFKKKKTWQSNACKIMGWGHPYPHTPSREDRRNPLLPRCVYPRCWIRFRIPGGQCCSVT